MGLGDWAMAGLDFASAEYFRDKSSDEATFAREWNKEMDNTKYQRQVADMRAAGLNPMLAYMHGPGSPTASPVGGAGSSTPGTTLSQSEQRSAQVKVASAQELNIRAQTENVQADTEVKRATEAEIKARTPTHGVSIEKMRQDIAESVQRIETLIAQAGMHTASAEQARQNVVNLKEIIPQIRARVEQLKSLSELQKGQLSAIAVGIGKTEAEIEEIAQRIRANLPGLQAKLLEVEELGKQAEMPGKARFSDVMESRLGAIVSIFRAMFK